MLVRTYPGGQSDNSQPRSVAWNPEMVFLMAVCIIAAFVMAVFSVMEMNGCGKRKNDIFEGA
jgi:hypothetical protein